MTDEESTSAQRKVDLVEQWAAFCDRMKAAGRRIVEDDFPQDSRDQAEGIRHLSRMVQLGLNIFLEYDDPEFPRFLRHNDDITQWGGNNPDNTYLYARIDAARTYRLYGNARTTSGFIVSLRDGFMHQGNEAVVDLASTDITTDSEGNFEVIISANEHPGNWLPMLPGATQIGIRIYFDDWERHTPPAFHVCAVDREGRSPGPLQPETLSDGLSQAADWVETNLVYWNDWLRRRMPFLPVNAISPPMKVAGGSNEVITYAGGRLELGPADALVLTVAPLRADYLGLVYYTQTWFETGDLANRSTSFNHNQLHEDPDGHVRVVVCRADPGHANWLDTEGRGTGLIVMRTINADTLPAVSAEVTPLSRLHASLPSDTRWVSPEERRQQIVARRHHIESRFHR